MDALDFSSERDAFVPYHINESFERRWACTNVQQSMTDDGGCGLTCSDDRG